jgi:hypothetical protein
MSQRPSRRASTSSPLIGLHQSGSRTFTGSFKVPNFGLSVCAFVVRTMFRQVFRADKSADGAAARCRPRRSSAGENSELSLRLQVVLEVRSRVLQWHVVLPEQRVHLEPRLEPQQPAYLRLGQGTAAMGLNRDGLKRRGTSSHCSSRAAEMSSGRGCYPGPLLPRNSEGGRGDWIRTHLH